MIIDTHAHFTPQNLLKALVAEGGRFPNVELLEADGNYRLAFMGQTPTRPLSPKLRDSDMRLEWMDGQGVDCQVVGGWLDSFGYELPAEEGEAWSRFLNEYHMTGTAGVAGSSPAVPGVAEGLVCGVCSGDGRVGVASLSSAETVACTACKGAGGSDPAAVEVARKFNGAYFAALQKMRVTALCGMGLSATVAERVGKALDFT
ncbi:MAG: hypothetical protein VW405_08570, partial [Rhodospirillaceae bacterium]